MILDWVKDSEKFTYKTIWKINTPIVDIEILWDDVIGKIVDGKIVVKTMIFKKIEDEAFVSLNLEDAKAKLLLTTMEVADFLTIRPEYSDLPYKTVLKVFGDLSDTYIHHKLIKRVSCESLRLYFDNIKQYNCLLEFEEAHEFVIPDKPEYPEDKTRVLRAALLDEEFQEVVKSLETGEPINICHESSDLKYVTYGALAGHGLTLDEIVYCHTYDKCVKEIGNMDKSDEADTKWPVIFFKLLKINAAVEKAINLILNGTDHSGDLQRLESELTQIIIFIDCYQEHYNFPHSQVFYEIHKANMSKFVDGKALRNDTGKILKGPNYVHPNLEQFFVKPTDLQESPNLGII